MSISLPPAVLRKYVSPVFVETGTYEGGGVRMALSLGFPDVRSVELDAVRAAALKAQFAGNGAVRLYQGNSAERLPEMLADVETGATFWLDAHPCVRHLDFGACPIMGELEVVRAFAARVVPKGNRVFVLIDDLDAFSDLDVEAMTEAVRSVAGITLVVRESSVRGPVVMAAS